jgi:hypothetical protein
LENNYEALKCEIDSVRNTGIIERKALSESIKSLDIDAKNERKQISDQLESLAMLFKNGKMAVIEEKNHFANNSKK